MDPKDQKVTQDELVEEIENIDEDTLEAELVDEEKNSKAKQTADGKLKEGDKQTADGKLKEKSKSYKKGDEGVDDEEDETEDDDGEDDVKESFDEFEALIDSEELALSEDFTSKAKLVFETAFRSKIKAKTLELEEHFETRLNEELDTVKAELTEQVDSYLNYVVEQWIKDNQLAIESGIRADVTESFLQGIKTLFAEHYVEVPEGKTNLVKELGEEVDGLKESTQAEIDKNLELINENKQLKRTIALVKASEGLSLVQAERLNGLSEDVDFDTEEAFLEKLGTIKKSFFTEGVRQTEIGNVNEGTEAPAEVSTNMARYVAALSQPKY